MLREDQEKVARNLSIIRVVASGRQWGKTTLLKEIAIREVEGNPNARVFFISPSRGAADEVWQYFEKYRADHAGDYNLYLYAGRGRACRPPFVGVMGADFLIDPVYTLNHDLILIDETDAYSKSPTWIAEQIITGESGGRAVFTGTPPVELFSRFFALHHAGRKESNEDNGAYPIRSWTFAGGMTSDEREDLRLKVPFLRGKADLRGQFPDDNIDALAEEW
jgi:hypothetical protein